MFEKIVFKLKFMLVGLALRLMESMAPDALNRQLNQPCYDKWGRFLGWYSRNVATAIFVFCRDKNGMWNVLGSERGKGAADFQGMWNCPCGYLDWNEDAEACALRELKEECGIDITGAQIRLIGVESSPTANHQNVTLRYAAVLADVTTDQVSDFSHDGNEPDEVGEIGWIQLNAVDKLSWAFGHKERIHEIADTLGLI